MSLALRKYAAIRTRYATSDPVHKNKQANAMREGLSNVLLDIPCFTVELEPYVMTYQLEDVFVCDDPARTYL